MDSDTLPTPGEPRVTGERFAGHGFTLAADVAAPETGPTVILTHGARQTRQSWARALRDLAVQGFHVISADARGHRDSDWAFYGNDAKERGRRLGICPVPRCAPRRNQGQDTRAIARELLGLSDAEIEQAIVACELEDQIPLRPAGAPARPHTGKAAA